MTIRWRRVQAETRQPLTILGFAILGAGLLYLFGLILFGSAVQSDSDILRFYYPIKSAIRSLWLNHHSLIWNPLVGEGQPLAGNPQHELFYPFTWLIFLLPIPQASALTLGVHFVAGWLGMRRLLGKLGCSEGGAILGAIAWGFGGIWISSTHFPPIFLAWTWTPWLAAGAAEESATFRGAVRDSLFGALILLIGEPMSALIAALAYVAVFFWNRVTKERCRNAVVTAAFSVAIAAATLLPGAALARKSIRAAGIDDSSAEKKSFPVARIVELVAPRVTGNVVPHRDQDYFGWRLYPEKGWPYFAGIYAGVFFLPLVLAGVLAEFRRSRALLLVTAGAFVLALGTAGRLWGILREILPFWRGIRYPEKFLALAIFLTVILMALGFDAVGKSATLSRFVAAWLVAVGLALAIAAALPPLWMPFLGDLVRDSRNVFQAVFARAAIAHLTFAVFFLLPARLRQNGIFIAGFLVLAAVDVLSSSHDFIRTHSVSQMEAKPPVVTALERMKPRPMPRVVDFLSEDPPVPVPGTEELNGPWDRNRVMGKQLIQWEIPLALDLDYDLTYFAATDRARRLLSRVATEDTARFGELLAQRSACGFLIWKRSVSLDDPVEIAGVRGCRPEVDAATAILSFSGDDDFLRMARENQGRLGRSVIIEEPNPSSALPLGEAVISGLTSESNALSFHANCPSSCFVRVARTNDGNWEGSLDERPLAINTVNLSLIGFPIPAGAHRITLTYSDAVLQTSMGISAVAFLIAIAVLVSGAVARRRRPSSA